MDIHKNARLTLHSREQLARFVQQGATLNAAAAAFRVSTRTAGKWARRFRDHGRPGLLDASSRPHRIPRQTSADLVARVEALRRQRWTACRIAQTLGLSPATVSRVLRRLRLNRMRDLEPATNSLRYEHAAPGDLLHLDIKKLARFGCVGHRIHGDRRQHVKGVGWEYLHVAIDDHSRIAYALTLRDQKGLTAAAFLQSAVRFYAQFGIRIRRLLTDNGPCYHSRAFRQVCRQLGIKQRFTRPYTPRTNGKAERFIQTALREWAYAHAYPNSEQRTHQLSRWLHHYNWHRPHASLGSASPISRSGLARNNLLIQHS